MAGGLTSQPNVLSFKILPKKILNSISYGRMESSEAASFTAQNIITLVTKRLAVFLVCPIINTEVLSSAEDFLDSVLEVPLG
uniref:Uncharacterized protein n=1 Tax=Noccaea caerulescens TaxID=107243 RepID=A0A1J3HJ28_NOCCA